MVAIYKSYEVTIDTFKASRDEKAIIFKENDFNTAKLLINVTHGGTKLDITDCTVSLALLKTDGTRVYQPCTVTDPMNGKMEVVLTSQSLAKPGKVIAELDIDLPDGRSLSSTQITITVQSAIMNENAIESANEFPVIQKAIEAGETLAEVDLQAIVTNTETVTAIKTEVENARGSEADLPTRLDSFTQQLAQTGQLFWEAPIQTNEYANTTWTADVAKVNLYDGYLTTHPNYVQKNLLGKDQSGLYDIHEYVFEPDNYEQTIFITTGIHGSEVVPNFAMARLMHYVVNESGLHEGLSYLRNKTKIIIVPFANPWGFNQSPREYPNVNGVNPLRNFPERWEQFPTNGDYWNKKGTAPFSEVETTYIRDILKREKDNLSFYIDCHTGEGWAYDQFIYYLEEDNYLRPALLNVVNWLDDRIRRLYGREPVNEVKETSRALNLFYAQRALGIPSACVEFGTGRYGGANTGTEDLTAYLTNLYNYIWHGLRADCRNRINQDKAIVENVNGISFKTTVSGHGEKYNREHTYQQIIDEFYEPLRLANNTYITRSLFGKDATGTYDVWKYELTPKMYDKTILLLAGISGKEFKGVINLQRTIDALVNSRNPLINELRNTTRFIVVPVVNVWQYRVSMSERTGDLTLNGNGVALNTNFNEGTPQAEVSYIKQLLDGGTVDYALLFMSAYGNELATPIQIHSNPTDNGLYGMLDSISDKYGVPLEYTILPSNSLQTLLGYANTKLRAFGVNTESFVLPARNTDEYSDLGLEPKELNLCLDLSMNLLRLIGNLNDHKIKRIRYKATNDSQALPTSASVHSKIGLTEWTFKPSRACYLYIDGTMVIRSDADNNMIFVGVEVVQNAVKLISASDQDEVVNASIGDYKQLHFSYKIRITGNEPVTVYLSGYGTAGGNIRRLNLSYEIN